MSDFTDGSLDWITFKSSIWVGLEHNYTESISLRPDGPERPDRPRCARFERTDKDWRFVMRDQTAVIVPNTNVSFVVFSARKNGAFDREPDNKAPVSGESATDGADGQNDVKPIHDTHPGENISDTLDTRPAVTSAQEVQQATPAPKRRGRPPKYPRPM